jgi:hypothetical protein
MARTIAKGKARETVHLKSEAGDSLEMIKRELAESAEVIHQEMEAVLERTLLNVTQDVVALREGGRGSLKGCL